MPPEAAVTPLVTRLPLDEGAAAWANALLKLHEAEQTSGAEQVRQGGFDVADVAGESSAHIWGVSMEKPTISVVIPVFNAEETISRWPAVRSGAGDT